MSLLRTNKCKSPLINLLALLISIALAGCQPSTSDGGTLDALEPENPTPEDINTIEFTSNFPKPGERGAFAGVPAHIAFYSGQPGSYELSLMDEDGGNVQSIGGPEVYEQFASYSPEGDRVVYSANDADSLYRNLYIEDLQSGEITKITEDFGNALAPVWSPDGSLLLFIVDAGLGRDIYRINADGTDLLALSSGKGMEGAPSWSPDGTQIVFVSDRDGNEELYRMQADGNDVVRLTTSEEAVDTAPAWSPDGSRIAFVSNRDGDFEIYAMTLPEGNITTLTDNASAYDWSPIWSPDGSTLLFSSTRESSDNTTYQIYVMDADGSNQRQLTDNAANNILPFWWPQG